MKAKHLTRDILGKAIDRFIWHKQVQGGMMFDPKTMPYILFKKAGDLPIPCHTRQEVNRIVGFDPEFVGYLDVRKGRVYLLCHGICTELEEYRMKHEECVERAD